MAPPVSQGAASDAVGPTAVQAPTTPSIPAGAIRIRVWQDAAAIVAAHPPGTTYAFAPGVHRGVEIGVRSGDTYLGEPGAVLDAAVPLNPSGFTSAGSVQRLSGVRSDATTALSDTCLPWYQGGIARCGHEQEVYRSEMLLAGGQRLRHVNSPSDVDSDSWHYDATAATITVAVVEDLAFAAADFAFAGWGTTDVTIAGLHLRNYASPTQMGAIDALGTDRWVIDGVVVTGSHGYGIRIGRSTSVTNSVITDNGHLGLGGNAEETPLSVIGNEIAGNGWLGVQPGFESGGLKATFTHGARITDNWVHDNAAKGIWLDGYNLDATIARNRVERSGQTGILYEISYAGTIEGNALIDNHTSGDTSESYGNLQVVDSRDVLVRDNLLRGGGAQELTIIAADQAPGVANVTVRDNDVTIDTTWPEGTYGLKDLRTDRAPLQGIVFQGNHLNLVHTPAAPFAWDTRLIPSSTWAGVHGDHVHR